MSYSIRHLAASPHRMMFFAGMLQGVLTVAWWLADLGARHGGWYAPVAWSVPAGWAHAYLMIYGLFPFFMFGFLMTAMPNWLGDVTVERRQYVWSWGLMIAGMLAFYAGLVTGHGYLAAGVALHLCGWAAGWAALAQLVWRSANANKLFPGQMLLLLALGWAGAASFLAWLLGAAPVLAELSRRAGVWLFLLPSFISVSSRLIPFFSSRVLDRHEIARPPWAVPVLLSGSAAHGALEFAGAPEWLWLADAPMLATVVYLALVWGFARSFAVRLLAMLHIAFAGLAVALLLFVVQSATLCASGASILGAAPLHTLGIGYFAAMTLAMVSRVSLGHSGRLLLTDTVTWWCFLGLLAVAGTRAGAELVAPLSAVGYRAMNLLAGAGWLLCLLVWAARYVPMYWLPRADGRPG
ncbi:MAG: NnrS family protein [Betaproteobacteria bacterium]|nr:NnrS family protein [Betaproteobacteria bacterium]